MYGTYGDYNNYGDYTNPGSMVIIVGMVAPHYGMYGNCTGTIGESTTKKFLCQPWIGTKNNCK